MVHFDALGRNLVEASVASESAGGVRVVVAGSIFEATDAETVLTRASPPPAALATANSTMVNLAALPAHMKIRYEANAA